jgi:hypothetical protein
MSSLNPLEKEILKYEKKGFKVEQKRALKYGSRTYLCMKKGYGFLTGEAIYIYFVDGNATIDSFREYFKDYEKYYKEEEGDFNIKSLFLCSGICDEKLFRDLRQAMVRNDNIRNSIKLISLDEPSREETEKGTERKETKTETKVIAQEISEDVKDIMTKIRKFTLHKSPKNEKELDSAIVHYLSAFYPEIETQVAYQNSKVDAKIGDVGIEIKFQPSSSEFDRLYGQVEKYLKYLEQVIVVIGFEKTREHTDNFEKRLKERGWLNNKIHVISIK